METFLKMVHATLLKRDISGSIEATRTTYTTFRSTTYLLDNVVEHQNAVTVTGKQENSKKILFFNGMSRWKLYKICYRTLN